MLKLRFLFLFLALPLSDLRAETVTFGFAPVDGAVFQMVSEQSSLLRTGDTVVSTNQIQTVREGRWEARDDGGWRLVLRPVEREIEGKMYAIVRAVTETLLDQTLVFNIDTNGQLESVEGFNNLEEDFAKNAPEGVPFSAVKAVLDPAQQKKNAAREYADRIGMYAGKSLPLNWKDTIEIDLPQQPGAKIHRQYQLTESDSVVLVNYSGATDAAALSALLEKPLKSWKDGAGADIEGVKLVERGELRIDPQTSMPQAQTTAREFIITVPQGDGEPAMYRQIEYRTVQFHYADTR